MGKGKERIEARRVEIHQREHGVDRQKREDHRKDRGRVMMGSVHLCALCGGGQGKERIEGRRVEIKVGARCEEAG